MARAASLWVVTRAAPMASAWSDRPEFYVSESQAALGVPLEGFADKTAAEAARKKLERAAREAAPIGPFLRFRLHDGLNDLVAAAKAAGLMPPDLAALGPRAEPLRQGNSVTYTAEYTDYTDRVERLVAAWWAGVVADITPQANATLWDKLFPDFRFYILTRVHLGG